MRRVLIALFISMLATVAQAMVPTADADGGKCSALFKVADADGTPVYNATIHIKLERHLIALPGFFTFRGIWSRDRDVEVLTDSNGEARVEGLPDSPKQPLVFDISKARFMSLIVFAPENNCHPTFNVKLE